ncbi:hypothetical protein U9M48_036916, partial [Paspalum notatum var. saurae]
MAATNPSYYQSGVCHDISHQKEHRFHLYLGQHLEGASNGNEKIIVEPGVPKWFGRVVADDWTIRDGPAIDAKIVGRARGLHMGTGKADECWLHCHSIMFTDTRSCDIGYTRSLDRFKGSSLKVLGDFLVGDDGVGKDGEWAIVGGTGEFAYARGVITAKLIENFGPTYHHMWELHIRAFCLCFLPHAKKMGPWDGNCGTAFDISELPRSLQTVTIRCGDVNNSLGFSYTDEVGQKKTVGQWGGDTGALIATVTLGPLEVIKQVIGTIGTVGGDTVVTSLTLVTNVTTYGPFGKANGTPVSTK